MSNTAIEKTESELSKLRESIRVTKLQIHILQRSLNSQTVEFYKKENYIEQLNKKLNNK